MDELRSSIEEPAVDYVPDLPGEYYLGFLERIHQTLRPKTYFEIGTRFGESLERATCGSVAVDPQFSIHHDILGSKPFCLLYRMTSDQFFASYDLSQILNNPLDFAFLDGMHLFEYLLRDFANAERHCKRNSVIALHDCVPVEIPITVRSESNWEIRKQARHQEWWMGDVWKVVVILKEYRPELKITTFDAPPSGLVTITNLDPSSRTIWDQYFNIIEKYRNVTLDQYGLQQYIRSLEIRNTSELMSLEDFGKFFWF